MGICMTSLCTAEHVFLEYFVFMSVFVVRNFFNQIVNLLIRSSDMLSFDNIYFYGKYNCFFVFTGKV